MELLTEIYGLDPKDRKHRLRLKERLISEFKDSLIFGDVTYHSPQIVICANGFKSTTFSSYMNESKGYIVRQSVKYLREDILNMIKEAPNLPWPPKVVDLNHEKRQPPERVKYFYKKLINDTHHIESEQSRNFTLSFAQDLVHAVSRGKFLTTKHVLLGNGIHSITGLEKPIQILSKFGHSCSYNKVQKIETAQAEVVQQMARMNFPLPLLPKNDNEKASTKFWWDNFDCKKENLAGSIHTTHGIAYQEHSQGTKEQHQQIDMIPSNRTTVQVIRNQLPSRKINPHTNPSLFINSSQNNSPDIQILAENELLLWKIARRIHTKSKQSIPRFVGWVIKSYQEVDTKKTVITYLPPINKPISNYSTVTDCIIRSQKLAQVSNMKYTNITVDAGAAAKFYQVVWNNLIVFKNVVIHLGDMHGFMEFFRNIGKAVTGSGFEDIIYQAELCTTGGIKGVLSGKHYNRSWMVYECFAEAIDRLFCESFIDIPPDQEEHFQQCLASDSSSNCDLFKEKKTFVDFNNLYKQMKEDV